MLTFDEAAHKYFWNGKPVPGVTSILQTLHNFDGVPPEILGLAQARGTAVHLACEYHDKGILDESSIDPAIAGYLAGWKKFCAEMRPQWSLIESTCYHAMLRYAGTLDRFGVIHALSDTDEFTLDIKTGIASHPVWGTQTAAYSNAINKPKARRATVQLRDDGTYRFLEWKSASDWPVFVALITIRNFLEQHK